MLRDRVSEINKLCDHKYIDDMVYSKYEHACIKSMTKHLKTKDIRDIRMYESIFNRYFKEEYIANKWVEPTYLYGAVLKFMSLRNEAEYIERLSDVLSVDVLKIKDGVEYVTQEYTMTIEYTHSSIGTELHIKIIGKLNINTTLLKSVHLYPPIQTM